MNKQKTIDEIDSILIYIRMAGIRIGEVGMNSDYVYLAQFEQFIMKLDEVRNDLYKIERNLESEEM